MYSIKYILFKSNLHYFTMSYRASSGPHTSWVRAVKEKNNSNQKLSWKTISFTRSAFIYTGCCEISPTNLPHNSPDTKL